MTSADGWLLLLAEVAREAQGSFDEAPGAVGEVVLRRPDEVHVRPSVAGLEAVRVLTFRRPAWTATSVVTAYLREPVARAELTPSLGQGEEQPPDLDQIGERTYVCPVPDAWELRAATCTVTVDGTDRVTTVSISLPRIDRPVARPL